MSKLLKLPSSEGEWNRFARQLIRSQMALLDWPFPDLVSALKEIGVEEDMFLLRNRIGLGKFRATLFLQCLMAMGVDVLRLPLVVDVEGTQKTETGSPEVRRPTRRSKKACR